ncbi:MAG TPA: MmcQ/YjbR family DNA-binding protein [Pseudonocardia sp.]|nr:MmcQ/YjbR family DNA-binding protein [Pseudonocardia sp.]
MREPPEVPGELVDRLGAVCLALPEAYQEPAWVGVRWWVRGRTFAHVLKIEDGWPPAYARAVDAGGPLVVLTFRSSAEELAALANTGYPFFRPTWGPNVVGMVLDGDVDWAEVTELLIESYCLRAPRKLTALVDRPGS